MELYRELSQIPSDFGPSVVTIGNFDGVHSGHAEVIGQVTALAEKHGFTSVAVSFDPHPARVHRPELAHREIMAQEDRQRYLAELGLDTYVLINYTLEFAAKTPEQFVRETFVDALHAKFVVIGADVRFGKDNEGNLDTMRSLGEEFGFDVVVVDDLMADTDHRNSSTRIRELLSIGEVEEAARLLGRNHIMTGEIVHGLARGRELGFPTANLSLESNGFIPADGVYACWLIDEDGVRYPAATSVGTNPTFEGIVNRQVEAHVIGRPEEPVESFDLYGQHITLEFVKRLRPMVAYTGVEALIEQIAKDTQDAHEALGV